MSTALRSVGLLDVLSSMSAGPSVALAEMRQMRLVSSPVCAAATKPCEKCGLKGQMEARRIQFPTSQ